MYAEFEKKNYQRIKAGRIQHALILYIFYLANGGLKHQLWNQKSIFILTRDKDGISVLEFIILIYRNSTCLLSTI